MMNRSERAFLDEYSSDAAILKYSKNSAGKGINYLLEYEYGPVYLDAYSKRLSSPPTRGARILEFGCGAGMNVIHCIALLERRGISVASAYGTDFSERLVAEAHEQARALPLPLRERLRFLVARNERLVPDMAAGLNEDESELVDSFDLVFGVNTFRYPCRLGKGKECAQHVYRLLKPGGVCVVIDMNNKFPMFRSLLRDRLTKPADEYYLPSLEQYADPFASVGFEILQRRNFCWIPHSSGTVLLSLARLMTPVLNAIAQGFAMRSLVVARKPSSLVSP